MEIYCRFCGADIKHGDIYNDLCRMEEKFGTVALPKENKMVVDEIMCEKCWSESS